MNHEPRCSSAADHAWSMPPWPSVHCSLPPRSSSSMAACCWVQQAVGRVTASYLVPGHGATAVARHDCRTRTPSGDTKKVQQVSRSGLLGFSFLASKPRRPPHFPPTRPRRGRGWWRRPEPAAGLHLSTRWRVENDPSLLVGFVGSRVHPCSLARSLFALADLLNPLESRNIRRAWWWNPNFLHNAPFVSLSLSPSPPSPYNGAVKRVVCVFFLCDGARVSTNVLYLRDGDYTRYQL
jgi:hypothetical protein